MFERFLELFSSALAGLYAVIPSYGVSIILLTLLVRVLLLPLSIKQTRSMREMQRIQPEVKQIQARNKGNRQKTNEEMMALYKEHGVNPFGGCLPLLMQFPALIGLFYVIRDPLTHLGYNFLDGAWRAVPTEQLSWLVERVQNSAFARELIQSPATVNQFFPGLRLDCSLQASLQEVGTRSLPEAPCGTGILSTLPYVALVLFMGFTTYYQQKQMQSSQDSSSPQAQQMQTFAKIMPFMLMVFAFSFPTGVVIYWLTTNVWMIVQQRLILKAAPPLLPHLHHDEPKEATKPKATPSKPASRDAAQPGARKKTTTRTPKTQSNGDERPPATTSRSPNASKKKRRK